MHGAQPDRCSCKRSPCTAHSQTGGVANVHHARRTARSLGLPRSSCVAHRIHRPEKSTPEEEGPPAGEAEAYNRGAEETARRREEPETSITRQAKGSGRRRHHSRRSRVESHVSVLWRCKVRCTDPGVLGVLGVLRAACCRLSRVTTILLLFPSNRCCSLWRGRDEEKGGIAPTSTMCRGTS